MYFGHSYLYYFYDLSIIMLFLLILIYPFSSCRKAYLLFCYVSKTKILKKPKPWTLLWPQKWLCSKYWSYRGVGKRMWQHVAQNPQPHVLPNGRQQSFSVPLLLSRHSLLAFTKQKAQHSPTPCWQVLWKSQGGRASVWWGGIWFFRRDPFLGQWTDFLLYGG